MMGTGSGGGGGGEGVGGDPFIGPRAGSPGGSGILLIAVLLHMLCDYFLPIEFS